MRLTDYAAKRGLELETAEKLVNRPEFDDTLAIHLTQIEDDIELDDEAIDILDEYIGYIEGEKNQAYKKQVTVSREESMKTKKYAIPILISVMAYYIVIMLLTMIHILDKKYALLLIAPVLIVAIALKVRKNNKE